MGYYSYIDSIRARLSEEDAAFYRDIFSPVEVATADGEAWDQICVMPDGEIRV